MAEGEQVDQVELHRRSSSDRRWRRSLRSNKGAPPASLTHLDHIQSRPRSSFAGTFLSQAHRKNGGPHAAADRCDFPLSRSWRARALEGW